MLRRKEKLSNDELEAVLAAALFFISREDRYIQKLGYRLFLLYGRETKDYKPLYEVSINKGLIPVAQFIAENLQYSEKYGNVLTTVNSVLNEQYRYGNYYHTIGQHQLYRRSDELKNDSQIIVAPTSYGKTELILSFIDAFLNKNICIITPTKSLLSQTKKRIINHIGYRKIVTQPEMYKEGEQGVIAVLTQERLLRLLQNNLELNFDLLIIDEAHNLLDKFTDHNLRSVLLASVIIINQRRNSEAKYKYLTPFLKSSESLKLKYIAVNPEWYTVSENIKSEIYYFYDVKNNKKLVLDQFSGSKKKLIPIDSSLLGSDSDIIKNNSDEKNLIYLNKPRNVEQFAQELSLKLENIDNSVLQKASDDLKDFIHDDYKLAEYIRKGIIYHHGSVPESVRYYMEELYVSVSEVKYLIANSTLLEGVNIPATKMFILDPRRGNGYLSPSSFKNLVGRICRFGEIFNSQTGNLDYLLPEIHIIKGKYCSENLNPKNFFKKSKVFIQDEETIEDEVETPLLSNSSTERKSVRNAEEILENISVDEIITDSNIRKPITKVGQLCFKNNVTIFDIIEVESIIDKELKSVSVVKDLDDVFFLLGNVFFSNIKEDSNNDNIKRLCEESAQNFYKMLISWRILGYDMKRMISEIITYWQNLKDDQAENVYVGRWGDKSRSGRRKLWTNIRNKSLSECVNLAIVRLKEEFDFIDNELVKYFEILNSLELIPEELYLKLKYGTDDKNKIELLNNDLSPVLTNILSEKYADEFKVDFDTNTVNFSNDLLDKMKNNKENGILIAELKLNLKE